MKKNEAKFHTQLNLWLVYNKKQLQVDSFLIETKIVREGDTTFDLKELSEKERITLRIAKHKGIVFTNSDLDGTGTMCDGGVIKGGGFIFLKWHRRANNIFYVIDIDAFENYEKATNVKSLTESDAQSIAFIVGELKS